MGINRRKTFLHVRGGGGVDTFSWNITLATHICEKNTGNLAANNRKMNN